MVRGNDEVVPIDHGNAKFAPSKFQRDGQDLIWFNGSPFMKYWLGMQTGKYKEIKSMDPGQHWSKDELMQYRSKLAGLKDEFGQYRHSIGEHQVIEFIEVQSKESLGTVELKDGKLVGPIHLRSMIEAWLRQDKAPEEFMEFYSSWSNGYIESKAVEGKPSEDAPPAEELRVAAFAQNDEELSPVTVIEKLRDLVAADVDADPERGYAGVEAKEQMENYLELITEAVTSGSEEDVKDIVEDILEEVPVADYDGAEDIVQFLKEFTGESDESEESDEPAKTEALSVQKLSLSASTDSCP